MCVEKVSFSLHIYDTQDTFHKKESTVKESIVRHCEDQSSHVRPVYKNCFFPSLARAEVVKSPLTAVIIRPEHFLCVFSFHSCQPP